MGDSRRRPRSFTDAAARLAVLAVALLLAACQPPARKADQYEALYDRLIPRKAYPAALKAIEKAVAFDDNEPRRWLKLGFVQIVLNRPVAAATSYQRALDLAPDSIDALENLSVLAVRLERFEDAKRFVEPLTLLAPNDVNGMFASGMIAINEKRYADAEAIAASMIQQGPDRPEGTELRLRIRLAQGRLDEAVAVLEKRVGDDPSDLNSLTQLLSVYQRRGDVAGVRATALRLYRLKPGDPRYAMESVRALHASHRDDAARRILDRLAARYANNVGLMSAIGTFWRDTAPPAAARDAIVRLAARAGPRPKAALANMLIDMNAAPAAAAILGPTGSQPISADNVDGQVAYARALLASGRKRQAEARIADILGFDSTNVMALLVRARLALDRRDFASALTDAQLAAAEDQGNEEAALLTARIYAASGNAALTAKAFGDARSDFPDSQAVVEQWSGWLSAQRRPAQAMQIAADFARRHPASTAAWALYARTCAASGDEQCAADIRRHR